MSLWQSVATVGIKSDYSYQKARSIALTNKVALVCSILGITTVLLFILLLGWYINFARPLVLLVSLLALLVIVLNKHHRHTAARTLLSLLIPLSLPTIALGNKIFYPELVTMVDFTGYRFFMAIGGVVPITIFSLDEKASLYPSLVVNFLMLVLFDPIHQWLGVGFHDMGFIDAHYTSLSICSVGCFVVLVLVLIFFKQNIEQYQQNNTQLINELNLNNEKLETRVKERTEILEAQNEQMEHVIKALENKNEEMERFSYTVSHDLKAPLITIQGFLGFIEHDAKAGNTERLLNDVHRIKDATKKMGVLLDDLLQLSRVGKVMNPPTEVPFQTILNNALNNVEGQLNEARVSVNIADSFPAVLVDKERVEQVLQNLLDNAVKFMGDQLKPAIDIGFDKNQEYFFISDNGMGIAPENQDRIFGLFERVDQSIPGTGIGLALVKRTIELQNGRIWLYSNGLGSGTKFMFTLPLAHQKQIA